MPNRRWTIVITIATFVIVAIVVISLASTRSTPDGPAVPLAADWRSNWAVETGFDITIDAQGFQFPTAIAFVPDPGDSPKSPLYFVSELGGTVKVVTNDRTVFTFAKEFFTLLPSFERAIGMAGICLAPEDGYVFVTFSYLDADRILRNNIVRFESSPGIFSLEPTSQVDFTEVFAAYQSAPSHQIGPCQVNKDLLYVSVADGSQTEQSQRMDSLLGKILRMTLDGRPAPENPFYQDDDITNAQNYIWALGLRNPFGLNIANDRVFVADNGLAIDRFLEVTQGGNYLWDGSDASMGTNADAVFSPGEGVAHMDHYPPTSKLFPDRFKDNLFMMATGHPEIRLEAVPAIWAIPYDFSKNKLSAVSSPLMRYRGQTNQVAAGLAFGPDGLYFAPLVPDSSGSSQVLKITYAPAAEYPYTLEEELNPVLLINTHGCLACHSLGDTVAETTGPNLGRTALVQRLDERLNSPAYALTIAELDQVELEPTASFRDARREVVQAQGLEKIRLWLYYRILEPKFDAPNAEMPRLGISSPQAKAIADYLVREPGETGDPKGIRKVTAAASAVFRPIEKRLPYPTRENAKVYGAALLGLGFFMGVLVLAGSFWLIAYRRRRRNRAEAG